MKNIFARQEDWKPDHLFLLMSLILQKRFLLKRGTSIEARMHNTVYLVYWYQQQLGVVHVALVPCDPFNSFVLLNQPRSGR